MTRIERSFKPLMWLMAMLLPALVAGCGGGGDSAPAASPPVAAVDPVGAVCDSTVSACVDLGTAGTYVILTKTGITNVPTSAVTGNMGTSASAATLITGFSPTLDASGTFSTSSQVTGNIYAADYADPTPANLTAAVGAADVAYGNARDRVPLTEPADSLGAAGDISGLTILPGVHSWTSVISIAGDVTLSGSPTDVWILKTTGGITQTAGKVILAGGALAQNVFWQSAGVVDIQGDMQFAGVVLASAITVGSNATINGRLLSKTNVTHISDTVKRPGS